MSAVKLCKDCTHFGDYQICQRPVVSFDLVNGERVRPLDRFAARERECEPFRDWFTDKCGPKGKYFTPTPPE